MNCTPAQKRTMLLSPCKVIQKFNPSLHAEEPVFEYDCSAHPFREHLVDMPLRQRDGWLERPDRPGLGIEVDRGALERYRA